MLPFLGSSSAGVETSTRLRSVHMLNIRILYQLTGFRGSWTPSPPRKVAGGIGGLRVGNWEGFG